MTEGIEGKVVIITDASSGMGAAAGHLARLGASVAVPQVAAAVNFPFAGAWPDHDNAFRIPRAMRMVPGVIAEARA